MSSAARPIVFVSDFGLGNEWVGICHSVMAGISPQSPIVDLTHLIRPLEVLSGALLLADSMPYIAEDVVVLAVVDPNVGKDREVAIETATGRHLVGPDNGLLSLAWEAAGGISTVVEISSPDVVRRPHGESFRAPDTLCPAAAHLAAGLAMERLGPAVEPTTLIALTLAEPEITKGEIRGEVLDFNRFGNIQLNVREGDLTAAGLDRGAGRHDQGDGGIGGGSTRKHVCRLRTGRLRRDLRRARLVDDRARESGKRARGAGPLARPPGLDQPLRRAMIQPGRDTPADPARPGRAVPP